MITTISSIEPKYGTVDWITYKVRRAETDLRDVAKFLWEEAVALNSSFKKVIEHYRQQGAVITCSERTLYRRLESVPEYQQYQEQKQLNPSAGAARQRKYEERKRQICHAVKDDTDIPIEVEAVEVVEPQPPLLEGQLERDERIVQLEAAITALKDEVELLRQEKEFLVAQLESRHEQQQHEQVKANTLQGQEVQTELKQWRESVKYAVGNGEWYDALGVSKYATPQEVRHAYNTLFLFWDTDICKLPHAKEVKKRLNAAMKSYENKPEVPFSITVETETSETKFTDAKSFMEWMQQQVKR